MKIMVMSDEESKYIWEHYQPGMFKGIDLIISAGDLKPEYLQTLPTGETSMKVLFADGSATVKVDVTQKSNPDSPKTGDLAFLTMWMVLLAAATVFLIAKKRKEEAEEGYQA